MDGPQRRELRAYYEAEGARDYQTSLYGQGDWIHQRLKHVVLDLLKPLLQADAVLLDAGCAEGLYLRAAGPRVRQAVGLDLSLPKLVRGRDLSRPHTNLAFAVASLEQLPLPSSSLDALLCVETLEHVPDHRRALAGLRRVLRPGGRAVISVPTEKDELGGGDKLALGWRAKSGHLHSFSRGEFEALLGESGFRVDRRVTIDALGGRLRFALVSSLPFRAARAAWRVWAIPRQPAAPSSHPSVIPSLTAGPWQRVDGWLTRLPGLRRWSSLAVWLCTRA